MAFCLTCPGDCTRGLLIFPVRDDGARSNCPINDKECCFTDRGNRAILGTGSASRVTPRLATVRLRGVTTRSSISGTIGVNGVDFTFESLDIGASRGVATGGGLLGVGGLICLNIGGGDKMATGTSIHGTVSLTLDEGALIGDTCNKFTRTTANIFGPRFRLSRAGLFSRSTSASTTARTLTGDNINSPSLDVLIGSSGDRELSYTGLVGRRLRTINFCISLCRRRSGRECERLIRDRDFGLCVNRAGLPPSVDLASFFSKNNSARFNVSARDNGDTTTCTDCVDNSSRLNAFLLTFSSRVPCVPLLCEGNVIYFAGTVGNSIRDDCCSYFTGVRG